MSGHSHVPTSNVKKLGYFLVAFKEFLNGFDTGGGYVKLPLWIAGLSVTIAFAPYVLLGGGIFAALFVLRALYDERQKIKEELEKLAKKQKLAARLALAEERLSAEIKSNLENDEKLRYLIMKNRLDGKSEQAILAFKEAFLNYKMSQLYPALLETPKDSQDSNKKLLISMLRDYFNHLNQNSHWLASKKLIKQQQILKLLHLVTGVNPHYEGFNHQIKTLLHDKPELLAQYNLYLSPNKTVRFTSKLPSYLGQKWDAMSVFVKEQKKLRHFGKKAVDFFSDWGTGSGIATGLMSLFGVIVAGAPITWPLIVAIVGSGIAFGLLSLAYQKVSGDRSKRNTRNLDEEIKQQEIRLELSKHLLKMQLKPLKYQEKSEGKAFSQVATSQYQKDHQLYLLNSLKVKVPLSVHARMGFSLVSSVILAISLGIMIGLGIIWVGTLLFPALPFVGPTLILGGILSIHYGYRAIKSELKSIKEESQKIQEVAETKALLVAKLANSQQLSRDLVKSNADLLKEVIKEYLFYLNHHGDQAQKINSKYLNQEKIFILIEKVTGISRGEEADGNLLATGNDQFYDQLASYLQGKSADSYDANTLATAFKGLFTKTPSSYLTDTPANAKEVVEEKTSIFKKVGLFCKDHLIDFLGMATLGLMIPVFLVGPQAPVMISLTLVVTGAYLASKAMGYLSRRNRASLERTVLQQELIDKKHKLVARNLAYINRVEKTTTEQQAVASCHKILLGPAVTLRSAPPKALPVVPPPVETPPLVSIGSRGTPDHFSPMWSKHVPPGPSMHDAFDFHRPGLIKVTG